MKIFEHIFKGKLSKDISEKDLGKTALLNTNSLSGKINGLPINQNKSINYDKFLSENETNYYDLWMIFNLFERTFNALFSWKGLTIKQKRMLEKILFRHGKVAIIKLTEDGKEILISDFTYDNEKIDEYGYPKAITLQAKGYNYDGKKYNKNFAVIFNNINKSPTLFHVWKRINQMIPALSKIDRINYTSDYKVPFNAEAGDLAEVDLNQMWYSEDVFMGVSEMFLGSFKIEPIQIAGNASEKMELLVFQLDMLLTYLGFKTADLVNKKERETEMEIANNDKFDGLLWHEMLESREEGAEEVNERLGLNLTPEINVTERKDKDSLNGEENKNKVEEANEER